MGAPRSNWRRNVGRRAASCLAVLARYGNLGLTRSLQAATKRNQVYVFDTRCPVCVCLASFASHFLSDSLLAHTSCPCFRPPPSPAKAESSPSNNDGIRSRARWDRLIYTMARHGQPASPGQELHKSQRAGNGHASPDDVGGEPQAAGCCTQGSVSAVQNCPRAFFSSSGLDDAGTRCGTSQYADR